MSHHHTAMLADLRERGHRLTPQREMVLSVICETQGHVSADTLLARVRARYPYLNKSAIYRTLDLLCELNLVNQTDFGEGHALYEVHQHPHHHHLVCRACHSMTEIDGRVFSALEKKLRAEYAFAPDLDHFAIWGTCRACQNKPRKITNPKTNRRTSAARR